MDRNLALELVRVTEAAALASARWMGKGDGQGAGLEAEAAMHQAFRSLEVEGTVVLGTQETDGSKLHPGVAVGTGRPPALDVVLDPLECVNSVSMGRTNALSVIALAEKGGFLDCPFSRMEKIAVGPDAAGKIDLSAPIFDNLVNIAEAKRCYVEDLTVCLLDRKRNREVIGEVREAGARIQLIPDGDVAAAVSTAMTGSGIDVLMGVGDAKAGLLAAAALRCVGGDMQVRLLPKNDVEAKAAQEAFPDLDSDRIYALDQIIQGAIAMFAATGVTKSDFLPGVQFGHGGAITHSVVMRKRSGTIRFIRTEHHFDRKPNYS